MALTAHGVEADAPNPVELGGGAALAEATPPAVRISGIDNIQRVNALAAGPLKLSPEGLSVVYGGNATGKSGLVRILKKVCQARDPGGPVLPNVFQDTPHAPATATISFLVDDEVCEANWTDGTASDSRLGLVNVFDSRCAAVQVEKANRISYTPKILQLFGDLARAVDGVANNLREMIGELGVAPPDLAMLQLTVGTEAESFLSSLSKDSSIETIETLCEITDEDRTRMGELERALAVDPVRGAESKELQARHSRELKTLVELIDVHLGSDACAMYETLVEVRSRTKQAADAARVVFERNSELAGFGAIQWRALWEAARKYSEEHAYADTPFPALNEGDRCVLCQQILTPDARSRVQSFEEFVQAEAQKQATVAAEAVNVSAQTLMALDLPRDVRLKIQDTGVTNAETKENLRRFLVIAKICRRQVLLLFGEGTSARRPALPDAPDLSPLIARLSSDALSLRRATEDKGRKEMLAELVALKDRVMISGHLDNIKGEITRLKSLSQYKAAIDDCKTQPITLKRRAAAEIVLTGHLQAAFSNNLLALGFGGSPVEYKLGAGEHGDHPVEMRLIPRPDVGLADVLSEGERTCVALAGLLAELDTTGNRSALVLDDPVTSLDHQYRKRVAERLLHEAVNRQVVVLTHDIVFLFLLRKYQADLKVPMSEANVHRGYRGEHGRVTAGPPWEAMYVKDRITRLRTHLDHARRVLRDEGRQAYEGHAGEIYKNLRMCWERAVEEVLLNQAVLRFGDSIQTRRLAKLVDITEADLSTIDREMGRCSDFEHDESGAVKADLPEPDVIAEDIERLFNWVKELRTTRGRS
jgi:hypothetical protein